MKCPECGFTQDEAQECRRCGTVIRKCQAAAPRRTESEKHARPVRAHSGLVRRAFRILRWASLIASSAVLVLLLWGSEPPRVETRAHAAGESKEKAEEFERAWRSGAPAELRMDEAELNGWAQSNLALQRPLSPTEIARSVMNGHGLAAPPAEPKTNIRDVKIGLEGDRLAAWVSFDLHGVEVTLQLEGMISARDGYLRLQPTSGKLGSLPLSSSILDQAVARLFDSPENREKFKLPPHIADVRVDNGNLVVTSH